MKKIFMYNTTRELLIYLLITNLNDETVWVYMEDMPFLENLKGKKVSILESDLDHKNRRIRKLKKMWFIIKNRIYLRFCLRNRLKNYHIYGYGHTKLAYLFRKEKIFLIEDGLLNYINFPNSRYVLESKKIEKVYLTSELIKALGHPKKIGEKEIEKLEVVDIKKLWESKSEGEKEKILKIFNFDPSILEDLKEYSKMLITQPLSEDGHIEEKEKMELYKKVVEKEKLTKFIIKPHPRETTDYLKYFEGAYILKEKYPLELLFLMGFEIYEITTLFSTGVIGVGEGVKVLFYGTEVHPKLYEKFGTMDDIVKRNSYL